MPTTSQAFVTPTVLHWARRRIGATRATLAKRLSTKAESIASWEAGETRPTFRQAEKLAEKLRVPFGYLFLPTPPEETIPLPDFRTVGGTGLSSPTADFMDLLYDVLAKHLWYRELLENEGRPELTFVASFNLDARPEDVSGGVSLVVET